MNFQDPRPMYAIDISNHILGVTPTSENHCATSEMEHQTMIHSRFIPGNVRLMSGIIMPSAVPTVRALNSSCTVNLNGHNPSMTMPGQQLVVPDTSQELNLQNSNVSHTVVQNLQMQNSEESDNAHAVYYSNFDKDKKSKAAETVLGESCMDFMGLDTHILKCERSRPVDASDQWCLVCDKTLNSGNASYSASDNFLQLNKATMSVSQRKLSSMLGRLVGLTCGRTESQVTQVVCKGCFQLVDEVDGLEIELADAKMELVRCYEATLAKRQPLAKCDIERPSLEVDVEWEDESDGEISEDEERIELDPDCTASGIKSRRKRGRRSNGRSKSLAKVTKLTTKVKNLNGSIKCDENETSLHVSPKKRGRGRPRKDECEEDVPDGVPTRECPTCKKFVKLEKYLLHLSSHRLFPCPFCHMAFKRKDIITHLSESHRDAATFPCSECTETFESFALLRRHCSASHLGLDMEDRPKCQYCRKSFSTSNGLRVHVENMHTKVQTYQCPECPEKFNQKGNMLNHARRLHQGSAARTLPCDACGKAFVCAGDLRKHTQRVHLKVRTGKGVEGGTACQVCGKRFSDTRAAQIHANAVHTRAVAYPCGECALVFHSHTNMVTHKRRMHTGNQGRRHLCPTCGKGFCSPSDVRTHVRVVHESVRAYVCNVCGQSFKVASHLKYHHRRHTGEMPYECPHCGKCFHGPSHIADHVKKVHKTVYVGINQRRRLNLPDDAPPPPPGILTHLEPKPKPTSSGTNHMGPLAGISQHQGLTTSHSIPFSSGTPLTLASNHMLPPPHPHLGPPLMDHHNLSHNLYAGLNLDHNNASQTMVVFPWSTTPNTSNFRFAS